MTAKRVALVTGASTGIGRSVAEALARNGYVAFAGMRDPEGKNRAARDEVAALAAAGTPIEAVALDVTDDASVAAAVATVVEKTGQIDVVLNNAGNGLIGLTECSSVDQLRRLFETHVFGAQRVCRAVLPHMRRRKTGVLAFTSSVGGRILMSKTAHYCAAKAAMEMMAEGYKIDLESFGIDVVILEPGLVHTKLFHNTWPNDDEARSAEYGALDGVTRATLEMVKTLKGPDPAELADVLLKLLEMPHGQRPLRTTFGMDAALIGPVNAAADEARRALLAMYGA
ncbi:MULTISPECIES: SDR family NAD(P)-dependent oxidoreductase [Sorangium]|uniref:3-oxoacyl-ACP reductase n=1 Tax=Sorangium cellulosum TaxID=56 RepID=A0A4V0NFX1_SORCE|nr:MULTISPECIES: SDR family NAD(P)-dependent oxidoreductase [Sorangium]AUX31152.1 3-oxoacyl-ACP reductase [Sorangium cellulosum]WCQ90532.1 FabG-like 3-oxoacyl-(acyl-carrier-protein) reductase [Sorangium sp. Soce836]